MLNYIDTYGDISTVLHQHNTISVFKQRFCQINTHTHTCIKQLTILLLINNEIWISIFALLARQPCKYFPPQAKLQTTHSTNHCCLSFIKLTSLLVIAVFLCPHFFLRCNPSRLFQPLRYLMAAEAFRNSYMQEGVNKVEEEEEEE